MEPIDSRPGTRPGPATGRRRLAALALGAIAAGTVVAGVASDPAAASGGRAAPAMCANGSYTVARGDGWSMIARTLGVTTRTLLAANRATARTVLHPGQTVCAPTGATVPAGSSGSSGSAGSSASSGSCGAGTYTVAPGDGWFSIARKAGVSSSALLAANRATTSTALHPGRTVCLPAGGSAPSSSPAATPAPAAPPVKAFSAAENEAIIRSVWPDDLEEEALRIARRESNLRNGAKNWCCYGLFQIHWNAHKSWLAGIGVTSASQLLDPTVNANVAYAVYQRAGGWGPWKLG